MEEGRRGVMLPAEMEGDTRRKLIYGANGGSASAEGGVFTNLAAEYVLSSTIASTPNSQPG